VFAAHSLIPFVTLPPKDFLFVADGIGLFRASFALLFLPCNVECATQRSFQLAALSLLLSRMFFASGALSRSRLLMALMSMLVARVSLLFRSCRLQWLGPRGTRCSTARGFMVMPTGGHPDATGNLRLSGWATASDPAGRRIAPSAGRRPDMAKRHRNGGGAHANEHTANQDKHRPRAPPWSGRT
jgi:hypothetical protein